MGPYARPTMADIAREAGVSTALVSIVMRDVPGASDETRRRVRQVADELGYVPDDRARKLRRQASRLLGVTFDLHQPFHGDLVEHLYRAAADRGYDVTLSAVAPSRAEGPAIDALLRERCDAALLLGSQLPDDALSAAAQRFPLVLLARSVDPALPRVASVASDDVAGIELVVDHLADLGHRSLAHIDGGTAPGAPERRAGFTRAAERRGLRARIVMGGPTEQAGAEAMRALLTDTEERPTAVVAFNDHCASGVLDTLARAGLDVPADVSVTGYDDSRLAVARQTRMTTVSQNASTMAAEAVDAALDLLGGGRTARHVVLTPTLVPRSSTGPGRAGQA